MPRLFVTRRGVLFGLAAAVSFGVSAPLAKRLLDNVAPQMLAGLLYVGAFLALTMVGSRSRSEARLRRADAPRMTLLILSGGVIAPHLNGENAEQMQCIRLVRLTLERQPIVFLGFGQLPGLVAPDAFGDQLSDVRLLSR